MRSIWPLSARSSVCISSKRAFSSPENSRFSAVALSTMARISTAIRCRLSIRSCTGIAKSLSSPGRRRKKKAQHAGERRNLSRSSFPGVRRPRRRARYTMSLARVVSHGPVFPCPADSEIGAHATRAQGLVKGLLAVGPPEALIRLFDGLHVPLNQGRLEHELPELQPPLRQGLPSLGRPPRSELYVALRIACDEILKV